MESCLENKKNMLKYYTNKVGKGKKHALYLYAEMQ